MPEYTFRLCHPSLGERLETVRADTLDDAVGRAQIEGWSVVEQVRPCNAERAAPGGNLQSAVFWGIIKAWVVISIVCIVIFVIYLRAKQYG